jgi:DNA (cytosine-5)-methyltransferase 1
LDLGFGGGFKYRQFNMPKTDFEVVYSNDFDPDAVGVYNANKKYFKSHECHQKDIRDVEAHELPAFDVLLAGFPCQPFSNAGKRQGIHDENGRGTLFYECERIIKASLKRSDNKQPMAFIFENVRGILSTKMPDGTPLPEEIAKRMKKLGYNTSYKLVNASDYGTPQNRYRVIMVGVKKELPMFEFDLMDKVVEEYGLPSAKKDSYELLLGSVLSDIPKDAPHFDEYWKYSPGAVYMVEEIGKCLDGLSALDKFRKRIPVEKISPTIAQGRSWKNMSPSRMMPRFKKIWDNPQIYRAPNFYRRFALGEINGTVTASAQPENCGITHPFEDRRFTIREIARIQSFPDDFVFPHKSINSAYKVIGNAVPPILGWVVAKSLQEHLRGHNGK